MPSWVRYSISVYFGLLLAGALVYSPSATVGSPPALLPPVELSERVPGQVGDADVETGQNLRTRDDRELDAPAERERKPSTLGD